MTVPDPRAAQLRASDPRISAFVAANAGSGKTSTLVTRVARLLLAGAAPEAILCVTYTKAGAAEMQRRLFRQLGDWAVMDDERLARKLAGIDEVGADLRQARALFARALETPGGLKIQTIHAFCEMLLRRFPVEAGVSPAFTVLDDAATAQIAAEARADVAALATDRPGEPVGEAFAWFAVQLDYRTFEAMWDGFAARRAAIADYVARCEGHGGGAADVWRRCGFEAPSSRARTEVEGLMRLRRRGLERAVAALAASQAISDQKLGAKLAAAAKAESFAEAWAGFCTEGGKPSAKLGTKAIPQDIRDWLSEEQRRCREAHERVCAAGVAEDTVRALTLAIAYAAYYDDAKARRRALDFSDQVEKARALLASSGDAAWVLYKLDGGLDHVLLDEDQDTAPGQWDILRALTAEFFSGAGARPRGRTMFAVGDEKQSIFSFQGAAPARLAAETRDFGARARPFEQPLLLESWRSAPEVLAFVDKVIADPELLAGLRCGGESVEAFPIEHKPIRPAGSGCVDLWPVQEPDPDDGEEIDRWDPVDAEPRRGANRLLAARIAEAVRGMVEGGTAVFDRESGQPRACRYGDVMILVRRRNALFHEIIRALKRAGAPVAGADRLQLAEHGLFHDLLALGRFLRFPADDLSLAVVLRSPFADLDEESLHDLAQPREHSLWAELCARAGERPEWREAARLLAWAREEVERVAPFDFYCRLLGRLDGAGRSMRQRLLTRLSAEGEPALDAFTAQVLAAEQAGARDLESALDWLAALELEIKREQDEGGASEVRVMTAHGAKGLEAPVVILPDTTTRAKAMGGPLLACADGAFLWAASKAGDCPASEAARDLREREANEETARLLYVALTRARDRLIVAGVKSRDFKNSWYDYVSRAFAALETRPLDLPGGGQGLRFGADPATAPPAAPPAPAAPLPAWSQGLAPAETPLASLASPSRLGEEAGGPAPSPLAEIGGLGRWRRGDIIHRLLQLLPDVEGERREAAAQRLLAREPGLTEDQRAEMAGAALAVLADARFAAVFGPGSRAEVSLAGTAPGLPAGLAVSGRVDRLVVEADRVLVVDFKTNRPAPARIEDAAEAYILQMALYRALLAEIYPGRTVEAALLWTDGPKLMPVPEEMMDAALRSLG